jgi:hypothetical protein
MFRRKAALATAILACSAGLASATPVSFDFSTIQSGSIASLTYNQNGYTIVASAKETNDSGTVTKDAFVTSTALHGTNSGGLGVFSTDDSNHAIDGAGVDINDLLILTFNQAVKIVGVSFALVDGQFGGDNAYYRVDGGPINNISIINDAFPDFRVVNWVGTQFAIGALGQNDEFKLRAIQVTPIPVPPAALLLATGLLGFGALHRRKKS